MKNFGYAFIVLYVLFKKPLKELLYAKIELNFNKKLFIYWQMAIVFFKSANIK